MSKESSFISDQEPVNYSSAGKKAIVDSCGLFCSIGSWLTSDTGIKSLLAVSSGVIGYAAGKYVAKKKAAAAAASATSSVSTVGTTSTYSSPAVPTAADYSGVAQ
jgi:hypothetical protein